MQSLCTLRNHCHQWPRNTRYQADATPYLGRTFTGWIAPALRLAHLFRSPPPKYPDEFHVGFILNHTDQVRELYDLLRKAKIPMRLDLGVHGRNLVFQCIGPDSIPVEVRAAKDS